MAAASAGRGGLASQMREVKLAEPKQSEPGRVHPIVALLGVFLLAALGSLVGACGEGKNATATPTPEWFADFPGPWSGPFGNYVAPDSDPKVDPTGSFIENALLVNFRDDLPKERIAEILAQNNLTANEIKWGRLGSFIVGVDPAQRDAVLAQLTSAAYRSEIDYAETIRLH